MSVDEFDPAIERLFNRPPSFADSASFEARVQARLQSTSRVRTFTLGGAGLIGGFVAVKEIVGLQFGLDKGRFMATTGDDTQAVSTAVTEGGAAVQGLFDSLGWAQLDFGSVSQTQTFLGVACVLITLLTMGAIKLYQQV